MSDQLAYECPHCHEVIPVSSAVIDETINCSKCNGEFLAAVPIGRPVVSGRRMADRIDQDAVNSVADREVALLRLHPVMFRNHLLMSILFLLAGLGGIVGVVYGISERDISGLSGPLLTYSSLALIGVAAIYVVWRWFAVLGTTLDVTTQRTVLIRGILSRNTNEVKHNDVRNLKSDRNVIERLLNYGDLALSSSGQDEMEIVIHDIPNPDRVIEIIREHQ